MYDTAHNYRNRNHMGRKKAKTLTLLCKVCNGEYITPDTIRGRRKETCSKSCASKVAYSNQAMVAPCSLCETETPTSKSVINSGLPVYCSECSTHRYTRQCEMCNVTFQARKYDTRMCSLECVTEFNRQDTKTVVCADCFAEFEQPSFSVYAGKRTFCSKKCAQRLFSKENPTRYGGTWTTWLRRIHVRDGEACIKCSSKEKLEVHHFTKLTTFDNPNDAHYLENLGLLCFNCHREVEDSGVESLTDFYRRYSPTP